jgi:CheY-like chemotaxis protein
MVLDLMMPKFSGAEVLKNIRSDPKLASLPVIVLSNVYMNTLGQEAALAGAEKGLLKVRCTPALLFAAITDALQGTTEKTDDSVLLAVPKPNATKPAPIRREAARLVPQPAPPAAPKDVRKEPSKPTFDPNLERQLRDNARRDFLSRISAKCAELCGQFEDFNNAKSESEWKVRLEAIYRQIHFLAAQAGLAGCARLALLASALEALMLQLMDKPARMTLSARRTLRLSMEALRILAAQAHELHLDATPKAAILVVDDDPISNRLVVSALRRVELDATSFEDPLQALQHLKEKHHDILLLDLQMPGMTGFDLCEKVRKLPGYEKTPVIYVTSHTEFELMAKSLEVGAEDLMGKPILPMELAVKVLIHLLRRERAN